MDSLHEHRMPEIIGATEILGFLKRVQPRAFAGHKIRLGINRDGGYVLPNLALDCDALLSIGIGNDVSFDHAFADLDRFVLQFDHTMNSPPPPHPNCLFEPRGWGDHSGGPFVSLADMTKILATIGATRPLLKFDVESAEYPLLNTLSPDLLSTYPVIACELHEWGRLGDRQFFRTASRALDVLLADHVVVHLHANNYGELVLVNGVPIPDAVELTLLRRDCGVLPGFQAEQIPGPLDHPNDPDRHDLCLTPFL